MLDDGNRIRFLTKGENESFEAGIEEFNLKSPVYYFVFLPNELIETRLSNRPGAVGSGISSAIVTGLSAIQLDLKANGLAVIRRTQHHMEIATVESEPNLGGGALKYRALVTDVPFSAQSPVIQGRFRRRAVCRQ